jgi:hypothetical protein
MNAIDQHRTADELRAAGGKKDGGDKSFHAPETDPLPRRRRANVTARLSDMRKSY